MPRDLQTFPEPAPLTLEQQFLAFCRGKPAGEEYDFCSFGGCACGQFARFLGYENVLSNPVTPLHNELAETLRTQPWTFAALVSRLENAR